MDLKIVLFNIFFLVVVILPFILLGWFQQKRKRILQRLITQLAATYQCKLASKEFCGEFVIGLDTTLRYLFFVKRLSFKNNQEIQQAIDLNTMQRCKIIKQITPKDSTQGKQEVVEKLELGFFDGVSSLPILCSEFFNRENTLQLSGEYALIEKWEKQLNKIFVQHTKA